MQSLLELQYLAASPPDQRADFKMAVSEGRFQNITLAMRQVLVDVSPNFEVGQSGVTVASDWFGNMTEKLEALQSLDVPLIADIEDEASRLKMQSLGLLIGTCAILVVTTLCTVVALAIVSRMLRGRDLLERVLFRFLPAQFLALLGTESLASLQLGDSVSLSLTIVFLDIRDFTKLSEGMSDQECFEWLLEFTLLLSPIIRTHGGFIGTLLIFFACVFPILTILFSDKYMGDGILAIFEHPGDAIKASLQMVEAIKLCNAQELNKSKRFDVGVGIHYGSVILGTVGDEDRHDGTIISDAVNVASRLEALSKRYGCHIICSGEAMQAARESVKHDVQNTSIRLGKAIVSGRTKAVEVFDLFGSDDFIVNAFKSAHLSQINSLARDFEAGKFNAVIEECGGLIEEYEDMMKQHPATPGLDEFGGGRLLLFRLQQAQRMIKSPPPSGAPIVDMFYSK